jgi:hypothetical protein
VYGESEITDNHSPADPTHLDEPFHTQVAEPFITQNVPVTMTVDGEGEPMQHDISEQTAAVPAAVDMFSVQLDYGLPWDDFLVSPQFMFPFSLPHPLGSEAPRTTALKCRKKMHTMATTWV